MTCDLCKLPILPGQSYSLSEHGRLHETCRRAVHPPGKLLRGEDELGPIISWSSPAA